jgi:hypothetical protein
LAVKNRQFIFFGVGDAGRVTSSDSFNFTDGKKITSLNRTADDDAIAGTSCRDAETNKDFGSGFVGLKTFNSGISFLAESRRLKKPEGSYQKDSQQGWDKMDFPHG